MAEPRPRNWKAMRADRVLAMAETHFGERFASKEAASAKLSALTLKEQSALKKPATVKPATASWSPDWDKISGGNKVPSAEKLGRYAVERPAVVQRYARMTTTLNAKSGSQALTLMAKFGPTDVKAAAGAAIAHSGLRRSTGPKNSQLRADLRSLTGLPPKSKLTKAQLKGESKIAAERLTAGMSGKDVRKPLSESAKASARMIAGMSGRAGAVVALAVGAGVLLAGSMGSQAMAAEKKKRNQGPSKNTVAAKEADAAAKQAEAAAEQAKAETRRLELEAQARRDKREDDRRAADKSPTEQLRQIGLVAAPLAVGTAYGVHKAGKLQAHVEKSVAAKNSQLSSLARKVQGSKSPARLAAAVKTADDLKLTKMKTPLGLLPAGFLVGEAIIARTIAANTENETAREVLNSAALGLSAAAVSTVGTRLAERIAPTVQPNAGAIMEINTARETLKASKPGVSAKGRLAKGAGRLVLPALVGLAASAAFSQARAEGADNLTAAKEGAKAGGDVALGGAISEYEAAKARGAGEAEAVTIGTVKGAINLATFGIADLANEHLAEQGGVAGAIASTVTAAAGKVGEMFGWSDEARQASAKVRAAGNEVAQQLFGVSTAHASEKPVAAGGEDGSLAARLGGVAIGGVGGAMTLTGIGNLKAPPTHDLGGGRVVDIYGNRVTRGSNVARVVKAGGTIGVGLTLASLGFAIAVAGKGKAAPEGKAFLNEGAERKAAQTPKAPVSTVVASRATQMRSDGQTEGYTRRTKTGTTVQVKGYRTPTAR